MKTIFTVILLFTGFYVKAQILKPTNIQALYILSLKCSEGGVFANQEVTFKCLNDERSFICQSDESGIVRTLLPINSVFEFKAKNSSDVNTVSIPNSPNMTIRNTISYSRHELQLTEKYKMNPEQLKSLGIFLKGLPDTTYFNNSPSILNTNIYLSKLTLVLKNLYKQPLMGERILVSGRKSGKKFKSITDSNGQSIMLLPKGDVYDISFLFDENYETLEIGAVMGTSESTVCINYAGTKEIIKIKDKERKKWKEETARLEKERKEFEAYLTREKLSALEARTKELKAYASGEKSFIDNVILKVFNRNQHWKDKLIVCDLTGSMSPYAAQLEMWYRLNLLKEQNLQFVFFNDGDMKTDAEKKIGATGGIYYLKSKSDDELIDLILKVQLSGSGGDCPENNMEALIKGSQLASGYKDIIMIVDNHAPIKDISLLESFDKPVKIILCGVYDEIETDYLTLAWKTKGSIHTMEEDLINIGKLLDGQEIKIGKQTYRLMKNRFIPIIKL